MSRPEPVPASEPFSLDARILQAEQRLVARQQALGQQINGLARRVSRSLRPRRLVLPALGAAAGLVAVGWLVGRGPASHQLPAAGWSRLIVLSWPLLLRLLGRSPTRQSNTEDESADPVGDGHSDAEAAARQSSARR